MDESRGQRAHYLDPGEQRSLLHLARTTLVEYLSTGKMPHAENYKGRLTEPGAAFVTIREAGRLRGCIGYTEARFPLYRTVMECAVAAALEDPRFSPLTPKELQNVNIEISFLTPLKEVGNLDEIEVGRHGLMVSKGHNRGLLLPQVAAEYGWDRETFLSQTCVKAGLSREEWKEGINICSFEAQVFAETGQEEDHIGS